MLVTIVAGARPNFMKIAPIIKAIQAAQSNHFDIDYRLVHTGQHFDSKMSGDFFHQLEIPNPDNNLQSVTGTQAEQTASIMILFEKELKSFPPDLVLVVGDVTSTMACAITAKKMAIKTVHVEAGIRSWDTDMPEEINRMLTDSICDDFFTTSIIANNNLRLLNIPENKIHFVGNTMIDTLLQNMNRIKQPSFWNLLNLENRNYFLVTLHRPSNVDDPIKLKKLLDKIAIYVKDYKILFPVHPRTQKIIDNFKIMNDNILIIDPQPYLEFIYLIKHSKGIITDSGGITEEATALNVPCITVRNSTERPETVLYGTNELVGDDDNKLERCIHQIKMGAWKNGSMPALWDGSSAKRIVDVLLAGV